MGAGSSAIVLMALVISGYLFNLIFHPIRFYSNKAEGQKLFFMAAGSGLLLGAIVFGGLGVVRQMLDSGCWAVVAAEVLNKAIPVPHASRLLATIVGSILLASLLNLLAVWLVGGGERFTLLPDGPKERSRAQRIFDKLTERDAGAMAQLLRRAVDEQKLVMLTLKSRKMYCGRVFEVPFDLDDDRACIEILPLFSTWRDKDTLRMGEHTTYPVIDLWEAQRRLYSVEEYLGWMDRILPHRALAGFPDVDQGKEFMRRARRGLEQERIEIGELIEKVSGGRDIQINEWIKVILIKEVESLSFHDTDAYKSWFASRAKVPAKPDTQ